MVSSHSFCRDCGFQGEDAENTFCLVPRQTQAQSWEAYMRAIGTKSQTQKRHCSVFSLGQIRKECKSTRVACCQV